ncbi:MAG: glycosyltransferase [Duncaniella sp.]|nr:glycosyltransferase [Duncaniella sp.]MDE6764981.1 glycosyltransferase [Duncaniella sp.]
MNILHYTIGLPPERNGGSVVYAHSLIKSQSERHNVFALVCGDTLFRGNVCRIAGAGERDGFKVFRLTSPTTPTLIHGVREPQSIYVEKRIDKDSIRNFIVDNGIEVMHIHTFMGLPLEMLDYVKSFGVKVVYTTHDYYGICLGYSMLTPDGVICDKPCSDGCARCNQFAPSEKFLRLANSSLYHFLKRFSNPKRLASVSKNIDDRVFIDPAEEVVKRYSRLREYYTRMFEMVDIFHFNSSQTGGIFERFLPGIKGVVANVVTSGICDRRVRKLVDKNNVQIGFVASLAEYKGFAVLKKVLLRLYHSGVRNWTLNVWHGGEQFEDSDCPNIKYRGKYAYSQIDEVMKPLDLVVVPSKWNETFSLVTLEAMSFGVPSIVSTHVGAKDVVMELDSWLVYENEDELYDKLGEMLDSPGRIEQLNERLCDLEWVHSFENHINEVESIYEELLKI